MVKMAGGGGGKKGGQKGTCTSIVRFTPPTVFNIESCFAGQLYIFQRCAYYLEFDF